MSIKEMLGISAANLAYKGNAVPVTEPLPVFEPILESEIMSGLGSRPDNWDVDFSLQLQSDLNIAQFFNPEELDMLMGPAVVSHPGLTG